MLGGGIGGALSQATKCPDCANRFKDDRFRSNCLQFLLSINSFPFSACNVMFLSYWNIQVSVQIKRVLNSVCNGHVFSFALQFRLRNDRIRPTGSRRTKRECSAGDSRVCHTKYPRKGKLKLIITRN